jgi:transposase
MATSTYIDTAIQIWRGEICEPGMVTVSYDEKPGIQALAQKTPDRPVIAGQHASPTRDYEYQRLGPVSLLAGLDLRRGTVTEIVSETHKSKDFIELLKKLDAAYPTTTTLRLILDNHSAHISKETQRYLASRLQRFQFVFVPKHGSWLNLVENMFSKMARSMLREIRVQSQQELVQRIHLYFQEVNAAPVVFRWKYKMDEVSID